MGLSRSRRIKCAQIKVSSVIIGTTLLISGYFCITNLEHYAFDSVCIFSLGTETGISVPRASEFGRSKRIIIRRSPRCIGASGLESYIAYFRLCSVNIQIKHGNTGVSGSRSQFRACILSS